MGLVIFERQKMKYRRETVHTVVIVAHTTMANVVLDTVGTAVNVIRKAIQKGGKFHLSFLLQE